MTGFPGPAGTPDEQRARQLAGRRARQLGDDDADPSLDHWLSELQVEQAARDRARRWSLRQAAREEATLAGLIADLAERGRPMLVDVASGRHHRGRVRLLGDDFCALRTTSGTETLISFGAITAVRPQPGEAGALGDRTATTATTMAAAAARLAGLGLEVQVVRRGDSTWVTGDLASVGRDVLVLRVARRDEIYVPLASVEELSLTVSG